MPDRPDDRGLTPDPGRLQGLAADLEAEGEGDLAAHVRRVAGTLGAGGVGAEGLGADGEGVSHE